MFREEKGFTLIELIVVVAIIAILGAVVTPNILKAIENSRVVAVVADSSVIKNAALAYRADTGKWPEIIGEDGDNGEDKDPGFVYSDVEGWNGPYLDRWPEKNPWGGTYMLYIKTAENGDNGNKLYLKLDKVPADAVNKLKDKLGKNVVTAEEVDGNNGYISIYLAG